MSEQEPVRITDRRAATRAVSSGIVVARGSSDVQRALALGRQGSVPTDSRQARQMASQRLANLRSQAYYGGGSSINFATQRPRDPLFYWQQNNQPFDLKKDEDLKALRLICRGIYQANSLMASAIDIFSKWPVAGGEFACKDEELVEFYSTLFFDQLNYEDYLVDINREHWMVGEAWPLGSFNEDLGVWEDDELLNPDDVFVEKSPFLREPRFTIRLPETLRQVLRTGQPPHEFAALMRSYPELIHFTGDNARMPVSNILLKQIKFKADTFNKRGISILTRALRPLMQEEMLNAAQDAIADRLYTPLILAKIGASATDLGTQNPWIPTPDQIGDFEAAIDAAMAADFRVLTTHFAVDVATVFGRETMPNFDADFDRLAEKELQAFGLSKTMISGAGDGETYAADALNRDLVTQLLTTNQRQLKRFVKDRCLVVAEAQGHYDWEKRGDTKYPVMEEVLVIDEESGAKKIVEQPKLLVPDLSLPVMNMADDTQTRQFIEALRAQGVPISIKTRMVNIPVKLDEEIDSSSEEQVELAVAAQQTRRETYKRLKAENLPIPPDLLKDFEPKAHENTEGESTPAADPTRLPQLGVDDQDHGALAPTPEQLMTPPGEPDSQPTGAAGDAQIIPLRTNQALPPNIQGRNRPPESDEQRARMPKPATKLAVALDAQHVDEKVDKEFSGGLINGPRHVGTIKQVHLDKDKPLDEQTG